VLEHAEELQLTQDQHEKLESIDYALTLKNNETREKARAQAAQPGEPTSKTETPMGDTRGGGSMSGMGGGFGRGGRGMGSGGARRSASPSASAQRQALYDKLDDNDTAAFFEAEQSLTEAQKPRARELASKYREQLYNYRATHVEP
jgi:hypothetical protein